MRTAVIIHGARGGPDTNWFSWLEAELQQAGLRVLRPRLPTPEGQSLAAWLSAYDRATAPLPAAPFLLIGHSLGAVFALHLVERSPAPIAGLFLAAGFLGTLGLPDYDGINASFFERDLNWNLIRRRIGALCCWAGDDDPYVPLARSRELAERLGAPLNVVPGGGHLNAETGFTTFPQLRDAVLHVASAQLGAPRASQT